MSSMSRTRMGRAPLRPCGPRHHPQPRPADARRRDTRQSCAQTGGRRDTKDRAHQVPASAPPAPHLRRRPKEVHHVRAVPPQRYKQRAGACLPPRAAAGHRVVRHHARAFAHGVHHAAARREVWAPQHAQLHHAVLLGGGGQRTNFSIFSCTAPATRFWTQEQQRRGGGRTHLQHAEAHGVLPQAHKALGAVNRVQHPVAARGAARRPAQVCAARQRQRIHTRVVRRCTAMLPCLAASASKVGRAADL